MTNYDVFALWEKLRKSDVPYLAPNRFAAYYTTERAAWQKLKALEKETDYIRELMAAFVVRKLIQHPGTVIDLATITPAVGPIRALNLTFSYNVGGLTRPLPDRPCAPAKDDTLAVDQGNPARRADDWYPKYQQEGTKLTLLSKTTPIIAMLSYWQVPPALLPPPPTATNAQVLIEGDKAVSEILDRVLARHLRPSGPSAYAALTGSEIPQRELNL
ncbi:hypothetical protein FAES_3247 [Fibrella aestuarina BUZ 2]|uniref:Uncharacterized protein n=1 Tax=Fibrella aestuarina BUZ 2 TaxID=1166018 RepID=I0KAV3_9BACT|nr:hypothetical protein [Fibrella aestuarina]CCH01256.1 hypothetical protein FAES_3247 [Fibrella aestuarina BUZ 2]